MGSESSKKMDINSPSLQKINADAQTKSDMKYYEAACNIDPDLQAFDATLQERTSRALNSLVSGIEFRSLSFDSLKEVTSCLLEMNHEVVMAILQSKKDIWKDQKLFRHVEDYLQNSLKTLDFCTALEKCLNRCHNNLSLLNLAFKHFDEDHARIVDGIKYSRSLQELRNYTAAGDPFAEEFFTLFESVHSQQVSMLQRLHQRKGKLDKKLKSMKTWRRISNIIFASSMAAVLICSVVAAVVSAPPVVAAVAAAVAVPLGSAGKWFSSMWKKYEDALLGQREIVRSMQLGAYVTIKDLHGIRVAVDGLVIKMESIVAVADISIREEDTMKIAVEDMKKKLAVFMETIEDLGQRADKCNQDIIRARTVVLHRIIKHPTT